MGRSDRRACGEDAPPRCALLDGVIHYGLTSLAESARLATFLSKGTQEPTRMILPRAAGPLTGYPKPRTREEHAAFLMSAFDPEDVFDFSNPDDVAEFNRLYRRAK